MKSENVKFIVLGFLLAAIAVFVGTRHDNGKLLLEVFGLDLGTKLAANDSPVLVAGGSIHFLDDKGWTATAAPCQPGTKPNDIDNCSYRSGSTVTYSEISGGTTTQYGFKLSNVTDGSTNYPPKNPDVIAFTGPWKIDVYSKKDSGDDDAAYISICSNPSNNVCVAPSGNAASLGSSGQLTITPVTNGFYYEADHATGKKVTDERYHNPNAQLPDPSTKKPFCANGHCEEMGQIILTMVGYNGGSPQTFHCLRSVECRVVIGKEQ